MEQPLPPGDASAAVHPRRNRGTWHSTALSPRLYVLCGLPFAGKSTLARAMADRLGIVHVEVDRVHAERGITLSGRPLLREDWIEAYRRSYRRLEQVLRAGHSGVFDATSYRRVQRQRLRRLADACGVPMTVIYLDVAAAEARRRIDANRVNSVRVNVPDEDFATVANQLQPPGEDEDWLRYDPAIPVDQWVDQVLAPFAQEQNS